MADQGKRSALGRPKLVLFCLYLFIYFFLRLSGEIVQQTAERRDSAGIGREYIVGGDATLPRWRRQLYRAFFSPMMVAEEEGLRAFDNREELLRDAEGLVQHYWPF